MGRFSWVARTLLVIDLYADGGGVLLTGQQSHRSRAAASPLIQRPVPPTYISLPLGCLALSFIQAGR